MTGQNFAEDNESDSVKHIDCQKINKNTIETLPSFFLMLKENDELILNFIMPIIWCLAIILIMDRKSLIEISYMPLLGIFAAFLANCVPLGGGIVYIPAFYLLGVQVKLGVAFTVATMTIGNGIFGLLRWLRKDSSLIIWESFQYSVLPSSLGTLVAEFFLPSPGAVFVRKMFALFCALLATFVFFAAYRGGLSKVITTDVPVLQEIEETSGSPVNVNSHVPTVVQSAKASMPSESWLNLAVVSFLAGLVLVPHIGMGPALTTYLVLTVMGYPAEKAVVTGVITGGWASVVPFAIHLFHYDDVPYRLWVMVLPGVFFGAKV